MAISKLARKKINRILLFYCVWWFFKNVIYIFSFFQISCLFKICWMEIFFIALIAFKEFCMEAKIWHSHRHQKKEVIPSWLYIINGHFRITKGVRSKHSESTMNNFYPQIHRSPHKKTYLIKGAIPLSSEKFPIKRMVYDRWVSLDGVWKWNRNSFSPMHT